ncbi:DUF4386 family protein [Spongiivirga citrea]|uniref:DUF4386 family protein n=1 Tax=Spongiivirga citrea TaxID=1481457 RepID=A0A6M0CTD1_9FLAO|nr:DUF4386 family protein [Spongiivirga citrea]NER18777.1 DUF4386 family protein [Spongiivirga citrea]
MRQLLKAAGIAAIAEALIYIIAFITYGAIIEYPSHNSTTTQKLEFLNENHLLLSIMNLIGYILFGILLAVLVTAVHEYLKESHQKLMKITTVFGLMWVGFVLASGMISNIGLNEVIKHGATSPDEAMLIWSSVSIITEGLGGGNEIVGGIWVLLLSITSLKSSSFSLKFNYLGVFVGLVGILTIYPAEIFAELFGVSQIIWFIWLGGLLIGLSRKQKPTQVSE